MIPALYVDLKKPLNSGGVQDGEVAVPPHQTFLAWVTVRCRGLHPICHPNGALRKPDRPQLTHPRVLMGYLVSAPEEGGSPS